MLRTVEATFDPESGIHLLEPVHIGKPVRVLVTFMETGDQAAVRHSGNAIGLDRWLAMSSSAVSDRSTEEMEKYIKELRTSWDS